jgi:deazaflavin-dependent oxidoreductase (nitroreductase family)
MEASAIPRVDPARPRPLAGAYAAFLGTRLGRWLSINVAAPIDPWLMRRTRGRVGMGLMLPSALLTTRGARSGAERVATVLYFHDGDDVIVIASSFGRDAHPAWYHNLRAHPEVSIGKGGGGQPMLAAEVEDPAERDRLWALADRMYPLFPEYRERAAAVSRTIPIVRLRPR